MSWNRGARGIYGYTSKEALGSPISMLFDHRRGQEATLLFEKVARGENVTQHEMVHLKKGRTPIDVSLTICPIWTAKRSPALQSSPATSPNANAPPALLPNKPPR